jgi:hypothetical protein
VSGPGTNTRRRNLGLGLIVAGLVFLLGGWLRLRDAEILGDQISFFASSGIGGVSMVMAGLALVASANSRDETEGRLARIETIVRRDSGEDAP